MEVVGYEFRPGAVFQAGAKAPPKEVGEYLELLREQHKGELTPEDVVKSARNKNSPLHSYFEWSDTKAAEAFRLQQARGLIRAVVAIYHEKGQEARRTAAFVHISEPGAPHYRAMHHALSQKSTRLLVLQRAWREFQSFRKRYADLKEFADIFDAADAVAKQLPPKIKAG